MNKSDYLVGFLDSRTQRAYAEKKAGANEGETPAKDERPVSSDVALLRRVQRIVFGPNVTDLGAARTRLESLIDALDDDDREAERKNEKPTA
jgi:hypothetical protein